MCAAINLLSHFPDKEIEANRSEELAQKHMTGE